jgi:hypothetical protein
MLDPVKYPQYYVEKPDQLSEKFKNQYEFDTGDYIFIILIIGLIVGVFLFA